MSRRAVEFLLSDHARAEENSSWRAYNRGNAERPCLVTGPVELRDTDGNALPTKSTVWFCRCGASTRRPFCNGTHSKINLLPRKRCPARPRRADCGNGVGRPQVGLADMGCEGMSDCRAGSGSTSRQRRDHVLNLLWNDAKLRETGRARGRSVVGPEKVNLGDGQWRVWQALE